MRNQSATETSTNRNSNSETGRIAHQRISSWASEAGGGGGGAGGGGSRVRSPKFQELCRASGPGAAGLLREAPPDVPRSGVRFFVSQSFSLWLQVGPVPQLALQAKGPKPVPSHVKSSPNRINQWSDAV